MHIYQICGPNNTAQCGVQYGVQYRVQCGVQYGVYWTPYHRTTKIYKENRDQHIAELIL